MSPYYFRNRELIKAILLFIIICLIFFVQNKFWIPINSGDLNFPYDTTTNLKSTLSTFNYRAFFGYENGEISSFVYTILIYFLCFSLKITFLSLIC